MAAAAPARKAPDFKIILCCLPKEIDLCIAFKKHCGDLPNVSIVEDSILNLSVDAIVSPANSFGFMDGGIDMIYSRHFGWGVQERLQSRIKKVHHGELLVGAADIVSTENGTQPVLCPFFPTECLPSLEKIPFCISAPTMRVPQILTETPNPYLAARAVFLLIRHGVFDAMHGHDLAGKLLWWCGVKHPSSVVLSDSVPILLPLHNIPHATRRQARSLRHSLRCIPRPRHRCRPCTA